MSGAARACPILTTSRLTLRAHRREDLEASHAMWSDPDVFRYTTGSASNAEAVWRRMLAYAGLWATCGYGFWLIEEQASGRFAGEAGLLDYNRGLGEDFDSSPEAGWSLSPWSQGRGYAFEAMTAILAWSQTTLRVDRTVCIIAPDNAPSLRLAQKLGYVEMDRVDYHGAVVRLERFASGAKLPPPTT